MTEAMTLDGLKESLEESASSSQLIAKKSISLKTNPSKTTLSRTHNEASNALKELFIHSFAKLADRDLHEALHTKGSEFREQVLNNMSNITLDLEKLTTKWEVLLANQGHMIISEYSHPVTVELEPKTPQEIDYLKIIETLDWFCVIQDNLWMANEQPMANKQQVLNSVTKKINGFVHNVKTKANVLRRIRAAKSMQDLEKKVTKEVTVDA